MEVTDKRTVVIAMDGSPYSDYAFDWYVENAKKSNDEVIIVTCLDSDGCTPYNLPQLNALIWHAVKISYKMTIMKDIIDIEVHRMSGAEEIRRQLKQDMDIQSALEGHIKLRMDNAGVNGSIFSCYGKPGEAIVHAAADKNADLILCGTRGHGKLRRTIMGSVSSYVVHHSHVPVVVCRHEDHHDRHHNQNHGPVHIDSPQDVSKFLHGH